MKLNAFIILSFILCNCCLYAQKGNINGILTESGNGEPIAFANVLVLDEDIGTTTNDSGYYEIQLDAGIYNLQYSFIGYESKTEFEVEVVANRPTVLNLSLDEGSQGLDEIVVVASPFKKTSESPVSLRTVGIAEIKRNPGGNRDISRVIQSFAGVTTTASFRNDLIIRGGAPNENRFFLDDVEVPNINHFATQGASGGPAGIINVDFIQEVDFYSSAFPANRGNTLSSVFDFRQKDPRQDRLGFKMIVGASDIGTTFEGPIGEKADFLFSARRSYLQFLFQALGLPFLPTYTDFQAKLRFKPTKDSEIYFIGLGAIDDFALNFEANETEEQQYILNNLPVNSQWNYTNGLVYKKFADNGYTTIVLSRNMLNNEAIKYEQNIEIPENLIVDYKSQEIENKFRIERNQTAGLYKMNVGLGYEYVTYNNNTTSRIFTNNGPQNLNFQSNLNLQKYYAFGSISRKFINDKLSLTFGLRLDGNSYSPEMANPLDQFSPRLAASFSISQNFSINANVGRYFQLPPYTVLGYKEDGVFINRYNDITFIRADHAVLGFEYKTKFRSRITLEGYFKKYDNYPFLLRDQVSLANLGGDFGVIGNEPVESTSEGRSYGLELMYQQRLFKGFFGITSITLGRSQFTNGDNNFTPSSWDAMSIANLTVGKRFKNNWEVGVKWRFQSGLPYSPFDSRSALVQSWDLRGVAIPDYSNINTLRQDASNQIDIRIDKKWAYKKWSLELYLDVQNITSNVVNRPTLILDRPLDENEMPIGEGIIENPDAPVSEQRYKLKELDASVGRPLPTIGLIISI